MVESWYDSGKRLDGDAPKQKKEDTLGAGGGHAVGKAGMKAPEITAEEMEIQKSVMTHQRGWRSVPLAGRRAAEPLSRPGPRTKAEAVDSCGVPTRRRGASEPGGGRALARVLQHGLRDAGDQLGGAGGLPLRRARRVHARRRGPARLLLLGNVPPVC
eukprot:scaffold61542_cov63-Phaeocystis_antarctica.AAC.1